MNEDKEKSREYRGRKDGIGSWCLCIFVIFYR